MPESLVHYLESNAVCIILFGIMLMHNLFTMDKQEKIIKYNYALVAFMCYFVSDSVWAAVAVNVIPLTLFTFILTNFLNYIILSAISYAWLKYALALEQVPNRNKRIQKFAIIFPFIVTTLALITTYFVAPNALITDALELCPIYYAFQAFVPAVYIVAVLIYTMRKAKTETNASEKRKHFYVGFFPFIVVAGGIVQIYFPQNAIFCFCCAIFMFIFYIHSMEKQISLDPLTGLNNRRQLARYVSQNINAYKEEKNTFVVMMDINNFKLINDNYGHSEGDKALITVAKSLISYVNNQNFPCFLGRFGGDEFILIVHIDAEMSITEIIQKMREQMEKDCRTINFPYDVSVGVGYSKLTDEEDAYNKCIQRADKSLYEDKKQFKNTFNAKS